MKKEQVKLTDEERVALMGLLAKGSLKVRTFKRATGLLELDRGQNLQTVAATLPLQTGKVVKEHYAYEKNGSRTLLAAIEPLTRQRLALVRTQRTKKEYAEFCQALVAAWPEAKKIRMVQDKRNEFLRLIGLPQEEYGQIFDRKYRK